MKIASNWPFPRTLGALIVTLVVLLSGCSTVTDYYDELFGTPSVKLKPATLTEISAAANAKVVWSASVGTSGQYLFSPALTSTTLYAANKDGKIVGFDLENGKVVWQADSKQKFSGGVGSDGDLVLVGTAKGEVLAFEKTGTMRWAARVSSEVLSAPQISANIVVVRSVDGKIFGLDARDGTRKWVYQRAVPVLTVRTNVGALVYSGAVFAGFPGGKLVALSLETGNIGFEVAVAQPRGVTDLERVTDITSLPWVEGGIACAVAYQGRIACFDLQKGSTMWARDISSVAGLTADAHNIYVTDEHGVVLAMDKTTGATVWRQDTLLRRQVSTPKVYDDFIVVGDFEGYVHFLKRENGAIAARISTDGSQIVVQPQTNSDKCYVQTRAGGIFALVAH